MSDSGGPRAARLADQFETTQGDFIRLVESLTAEQWRLTGKNHPKRLNDEDEGRSVGVIAHHAASSGDMIMGRIQTMLEGRPLTPVSSGDANAKHAVEHSDVSREEVLRILRENGPRLAAAVRAIPDDQLDQSRDTPAGPMSIAQRVERVLIGHLQMHQGSIEAAIRHE
jgi:DinB superfamily